MVCTSNPYDLGPVTPGHICTKTGLTLPHLRRNWAAHLPHFALAAMWLRGCRRQRVCVLDTLLAVVRLLGHFRSGVGCGLL